MEVKSSSAVRHKSLDEFRSVYGKRIGDSIIVHKKDMMRIGGITCIPAYMVPFILVQTEREESLELFRSTRERYLKEHPDGMAPDEINKLIAEARAEKK